MLYYNKMLKILLIVGLVSLTLANTHLNLKYRNVLEGEGVLSELVAK